MLDEMIVSPSISFRLKKVPDYSFDEVESLRVLAIKYSAVLIFGGCFEQPDSIYVCFDESREVEISNTELPLQDLNKRHYKTIESRMAAFLSEYAESDIRSKFPLG